MCTRRTLSRPSYRSWRSVNSLGIRTTHLEILEPNLESVFLRADRQED